jgi:rhodanese-related sulfurtransferase
MSEPRRVPRAVPPRRRSARTGLALLALAGALVAPAVASCSSGEEGGTGATQAVPAAPQHRAPAEFARVASAPGAVVLDVRTAAEFAAGHLPGAVNLDASAADFRERLEVMDRSTTYAVYCQSGRRSAAALATMADLGFTQAVDLEGGIGAWTAAGGEVVTGP